MRRVLIISPHFPPVNAADMHRVRQALPYMRDFNWEPVVITVDESFVESYSNDPLLVKTIPNDIEIHKVKAFKVNNTRKFGLGSLSMRSYFQIQRKGDELLKNGKFDLVYFSTTMFHVMALGPRWKRKFGVPFVLDIQDPWRNDFYLDKPKSQRPPKFIISYNIDKFLEARTVPKADGIISVSKGYIDTFLSRYERMNSNMCKVIPFGVAENDFAVMKNHIFESDIILPDHKYNLLYIGRGGHDMQFALNILFEAVSKGNIESPELFSQFHFTFIGTSYAPKGTGSKTIEPLAHFYNVDKQVTEITDRYPYFESLFLLSKADALVIPGSTDTSYTASKIYPYLLANKPLIAIFNEKSSVVDFLSDMNVAGLITFNNQSGSSDLVEECFLKLLSLVKGVNNCSSFNQRALEPYTAYSRTKEQTDFFDIIINSKHNPN